MTFRTLCATVRRNARGPRRVASAVAAGVLGGSLVLAASETQALPMVEPSASSALPPIVPSFSPHSPDRPPAGDASLRAGGAPRYGRHDFVWQAPTNGVWDPSSMDPGPARSTSASPLQFIPPGLSPAQQALLGCGGFYFPSHTPAGGACDGIGVDLFDLLDSFELTPPPVSAPRLFPDGLGTDPDPLSLNLLLLFAGTVPASDQPSSPGETDPGLLAEMQRLMDALASPAREPESQSVPEPRAVVLWVVAGAVWGLRRRILERPPDA